MEDFPYPIWARNLCDILEMLAARGDISRDTRFEIVRQGEKSVFTALKSLAGWVREKPDNGLWFCWRDEPDRGEGLSELPPDSYLQIGLREQRILKLAMKNFCLRSLRFMLQCFRLTRSNRTNMLAGMPQFNPRSRFRELAKFTSNPI